MSASVLAEGGNEGDGGVGTGVVVVVGGLGGGWLVVDIVVWMGVMLVLGGLAEWMGLAGSFVVLVRVRM